MVTVEEQIDKRIGEVRTESLDFSFGEIINLYENKELVIQPEYQRLFRWSNQQKSRLIESVLLELPIPQIFTIENSNGVLELIDGLQRVSSIIQFVDSNKISLEPLILEGCDQIEDLNNKAYEDLPMRLKLRLKRSSVRTVIIKQQSKSFLRYEMFKRLNTGGSILAPQEIRNCSSRMIGEEGIQFYTLLQELASDESFKVCTETLSEAERDQKGDEELVLRFFAAKDDLNLFQKSVRDWLDSYMESILLNEIDFDYRAEESTFKRLFTYLNRVIGAGAFVRYRDDSPIGALAPAYFEAVAIGTLKALVNLDSVDDSLVKQKIIATVQTTEFKSNIGPGANTRAKLRRRIEIIHQALLELSQ
ncbi:MAG: DUF262 domain-containing protein [Symploca sp. SIO2G7]|nr:DUF262 domain-containing protein [Symploca sp. SIO2G7]